MVIPRIANISVITTGDPTLSYNLLIILCVFAMTLGLADSLRSEGVRGVRYHGRARNGRARNGRARNGRARRRGVGCCCGLILWLGLAAISYISTDLAEAALSISHSFSSSSAFSSSALSSAHSSASALWPSSSRQKDSEGHVVLRYHDHGHGYQMGAALGQMQVRRGGFGYDSRLPSVILSYSYITPQRWVMTMSGAVMHVEVVGHHHHTRRSLGPTEGGVGVSGNNRDDEDVPLSSTQEPPEVLDYFHLSQQTARVMPIYGPLWLSVGAGLSLTYPAVSILRPWDRVRGVITQVAVGAASELWLELTEAYSLTLGYEVWHGLRSRALWGHQWHFGIRAWL